MDQTRARITEAAFELHREIGPARTTISAIAERAGVQRHTVYRHFPDMVSLIRACTAHGMRTTVDFDPGTWLAIHDPAERLRAGLGDLYANYRVNEQLIGNIVRDFAVMPELVEGAAAWSQGLDQMEGILRGPWMTGRLTDAAVAAAVSHAMDFATWRSLTARGMSDVQARDAMVTLVQALAAMR